MFSYNTWVKYETKDAYYYKPLYYPGLTIVLDCAGYTSKGTPVYTIRFQRKLPDNLVVFYALKSTKSPEHGRWTLACAKRKASHYLSEDTLVTAGIYTQSELEELNLLIEDAFARGYDFNT